jgi:hypothetical protein
MGGLPALDLANGARVHLDDIHGLDCVIPYAERWRGAATQARVTMSLEAPTGEETKL